MYEHMFCNFKNIISKIPEIKIYFVTINVVLFRIKIVTLSNVSPTKLKHLYSYECPWVGDH